MKIILKIIFFLTVVVFCACAHASNTWRDNFTSTFLIGKGTLKVFVWELYDLTLFSESESFSSKNRFVLEFDYKRKLKKSEVIKASIKEMRRQKGVSNEDIAEWQKYLEQGIETVEQGTKAAVEWLPEGKIVFYHEAKDPIIINDELFARSFINIWLGRETSAPGLRQAILGQGR
tara:strand:- start:63 stop:587 length:525 start_codon:yes stop_codon:yes gene_type:complete